MGPNSLKLLIADNKAIHVSRISSFRYNETSCHSRVESSILNVKIFTCNFLKAGSFINWPGTFVGYKINIKNNTLKKILVAR